MSEAVREQVETVHVIVQARGGVLETAEVYADLESALVRYSDISSEQSHVKTLLAAKTEIKDIDLE